MNEKQRIEKACEDEAFQAALQRYAHAGGSSMAIMHAAARALDATEDTATDIASLTQSLAEAEGQIGYLDQRLIEAVETIRPFANIPPVVHSELDGSPLYAAHYWAVVGHPDKSHFTREDLAQARAFLQKQEASHA